MIVLITDALTKRKSFDIINSLKYSNPEISLLLAHENISKWSRIKTRLLYGQEPVLLRKGINFSKDFNRLLDENKDLIYLPTEEDYILCYYDYLFTNNKVELSDNLPSYESFQISRDKTELMKFCLQHDIPVPKIFDDKNFHELTTNFIPLVIKPTVGCGAEGVFFIDDKSELPDKESLNFDAVVIQERVGNPVNVIGMFYLYKNGELIKWYGHKRIRTYPSSGGVTTYSELYLDEKACQAGDKLLRALNWSGIAMVEMIFDSNDNKYKVIEVNPRFWGSILLGEFSGYKFIEGYLMTAVDKKVSESSTLKNTYIRWFFPFDLLNYIQSGCRIDKFWSFNRNNTCYINMTYAPVKVGFLYVILGMLDIAMVKKLFKKVF